jgi:hypothetical protein
MRDPLYGLQGEIVVRRFLVTHRTGVNGRVTCARGHEIVTVPCHDALVDGLRL